MRKYVSTTSSQNKQRSDRSPEIYNFSNIHRITRFCLKLWYDAEWTFKCRQPSSLFKGAHRFYLVYSWILCPIWNFSHKFIIKIENTCLFTLMQDGNGMNDAHHETNFNVSTLNNQQFFQHWNQECYKFLSDAM